MVAAIVDGERDCARVGVGESADDPLLPPSMSVARRRGRAGGRFGLSFPVGLLLGSGLLAGGKFKAARRLLFSSSDSATRCSRACERESRE
jgi:hypothetical protein